MSSVSKTPIPKAPFSTSDLPFRRLGVEHRARGQLGEDQLEVGLPFRAHRQPSGARVAHGHVGVHFEAKGVAVELEGLLLVDHVDRRVALA
jgi:hypothetical protein